MSERKNAKELINKICDVTRMWSAREIQLARMYSLDYKCLVQLILMCIYL